MHVFDHFSLFVGMRLGGLLLLALAFGTLGVLLSKEQLGAGLSEVLR